MAQLLRNEVPEDLTWDLSTIFDSDNDWELAFAAVKQEAEMLSRFVGHVGDSAALLQSALEADLKIERDLEKVYVYAHQIYDQDTTNQSYAAFNSRVQALWAEVSQATAYFQPEVLNIPDDKLAAYLMTDGFNSMHIYLKHCVL